MARRFLFALAFAIPAFTVSEAHAIGADHPHGPIDGNAAWPAGLKELVNRKDRVHGFWVNESDVLFYDGDTPAFNQFIDGYSKLKGTALDVVIHPGTNRARSPWDKRDERGIPVAWSLHASFDPLDDPGIRKAGVQFHTRVDIWLGSRLRLEELRIPAGVKVVSGGEIEKFLSGRQVEQNKQQDELRRE